MLIAIMFEWICIVPDKDWMANLDVVVRLGLLGCQREPWNGIVSHYSGATGKHQLPLDFSAMEISRLSTAAVDTDNPEVVDSKMSTLIQWNRCDRRGAVGVILFEANGELSQDVRFLRECNKTCIHDGTSQLVGGIQICVGTQSLNAVIRQHACPIVPEAEADAQGPTEEAGNAEEEKPRRFVELQVASLPSSDGVKGEGCTNQRNEECARYEKPAQSRVSVMSVERHQVEVDSEDQQRQKE